VSESYESRRKRWLQLKETLPESLKERIPLRNVQDTAQLPAEAQQTLSLALDGGLKQIPTALRTLKQNPATSAAELLAADRHKGQSQPGEHQPVLRGEIIIAKPVASEIDERDVITLAELFRSISPGANAISAEFWAKEKPKLLSIVRSHRAFLESNSSEVDFVVFCAFLLQMFKDADHRLAEQPSYRNALSLSSLVWPTQFK